MALYGHGGYRGSQQRTSESLFGSGQSSGLAREARGPQTEHRPWQPSAAPAKRPVSWVTRTVTVKESDPTEESDPTKKSAWGRNAGDVVDAVIAVRDAPRPASERLSRVIVKLPRRSFESVQERAMFERQVCEAWDSKTKTSEDVAPEWIRGNGTSAVGIQLDFGHAEQPYWPD